MAGRALCVPSMFHRMSPVRPHRPQLCRDRDIANPTPLIPKSFLDTSREGNAVVPCAGGGSHALNQTGRTPTSPLPALACRCPTFRQATLAALQSKCWRFAIPAHHFMEFDEVLKCSIYSMKCSIYNHLHKNRATYFVELQTGLGWKGPLKLILFCLLPWGISAPAFLKQLVLLLHITLFALPISRHMSDLLFYPLSREIMGKI